MVNETHVSAAKMMVRAKELFGNSQYALAAVCYQHAKQMYDEEHNTADSLQMDLNYQECLELARQNGQDYDMVKDLAPDVLLDTKSLQEALPDFSIDGLLERANEYWKKEDYRRLIETTRECQQFLPGMSKDMARQTRGYLDFYNGAAYVGLDRDKDALPLLRAANYALKELLHIYGEEMWACNLLYLGQAMAFSEPEAAEHSLQEAYDAFLALGEQNRAAGASDRDARYYTGLTLLELARFKGDALINGNAEALPELLRYQQEAVGYLLPLRDAANETDDADEQLFYGRRANQALAVLEKCVDRIQPSAVRLLTAIVDACEASFTDIMVDGQLAVALIKTAIAACQRAQLNERAAEVSRSGRERVTDAQLGAWLDGIIEEYEHREGLEREFALAKQAITDGDFHEVYPALKAASEHAQFLKETAMLNQIERLLNETRLRDPGMVEQYLEEIRPLLRAGNFDEAERQLSKLRTAQGNTSALIAFRGEMNAAKLNIIEQHVKAMFAALDAGDMDGVEEAKNKATVLARQLPAEPAVLKEARRTLAEGVMKQHLHRAEECVRGGDFQEAEEALVLAHGAGDAIPELAEMLAVAEEQLQAYRQTVIAREQKRIGKLIAAGQFAEANLALVKITGSDESFELPLEQQELLNNYQHARKRLLEAQSFASSGQISQADAAYRDVLLNPAAVAFRDEVQDEYESLKKGWSEQHLQEAERLTGELKNALGRKIDFKAARSALEALEALIPGSYDDKVVRPLKHRYELLWALAQRHYCKKDALFSGKPLYFTAGAMVVDIVLCVLLGKFFGWGIPPLAVIGLCLLAGTYGAAQCAAVKSSLAYTDQYHPFSMAFAGFLAAVTVIGLSFARLPWSWIAGIVLLIVTFAVIEFWQRLKMPIRIPE
ncbi:MAG: ATP-binding protein [Armatimonadota bacterium]